MPKIIPAPLTVGNNQKIKIRNSRIAVPQRLSVRQIMASPPTVSWSTTNTITGKFWQSYNSSFTGTPGAGGPFFTFSRAGGFVAGTASPNWSALGGTSVNYGGGTLSFNCMSVSFIHTGTAFAVNLLGYGNSILIKVDDQYVSMTPQTLANTGSINYGIVTFASAARRRIELLMTSGSHTVFGGIYTAATDTVQPAALRGPRVHVIGDSFTEGSLATSGPASNFPIVFGELMGWDDVWPSGVGSTGYLATSAPRGTYRSRLATDVIPYNPDIVMFTGSVNDSAFTPAQIAAEATLCFQQIQAALPNALIICVSPFLKTGASYATPFLLQARPLLKSAVQAVGGVFIDLQQMSLPAHIVPQTTTLAAACAANATSLSTNGVISTGNTAQFADGTTFTVTAVAGSGPYTLTVDNVGTAESVGAAITQVGAGLWSGNGHVGATTGVGNCDILVGTDGTHPTQAGHEAIGEAIAYGFLNQLYSN